MFLTLTGITQYLTLRVFKSYHFVMCTCSLLILTVYIFHHPTLLVYSSHAAICETVGVSWGYPERSAGFTSEDRQLHLVLPDPT